ncbi:MAG: hypothetical protein GKR92_09135 [Gammaproteobacteria bacterium]|nr:MAG: hypothetical protein GKR92_09135 [Gammaproteobacteria bacterium]
MNKKLQQLSIAAVLATSTIVLSTNASAYEATLTGNAGVLSEYIFRGIVQNDTASGNGGIDIEVGGFYAGTWIADVDDGIEYDLYAGYVHEFTNGFYLGAGGTSYQYSDSFDNEYNEANFYAGWSNDLWSLDLEYSKGDYNGDFVDDAGNIEGDEYDFIGASVGWNGAYLTYRVFGDDADDQLGESFEFGYGFELAGFDVTAAVMHTDLDKDPAGLTSDCGSVVSADCDGLGDGDETSAYVGIHRSFDIMKWGSGS